MNFMTSSQMLTIYKVINNMKWFDKWFAKKCKQAWEEENQPRKEDAGYNISSAKSRRSNSLVIGSVDSGNILNSNGTQFTLYSANGGTVIELRNYDHNADRVHNALYVIPSDKDLGEQLGHIITMEALKR